MNNRARIEAVKILTDITRLPLERCTVQAARVRGEIALVIEGLHGTAMASDDPLRYHASGALLSEEMFQEQLQMIIDSWPSWEEVGKHVVDSTRIAKKPSEGQWLAEGDRSTRQTGNTSWLSRK